MKTPEMYSKFETKITEDPLLVKLRNEVIALPPEYIIEDSERDYFSNLYHARGFLKSKGTMYEKNNDTVITHVVDNPFTYAKKLFFVDKDTIETQSIFQKLLEDKKILVLGGGNSLVDLCSSGTIKPRQIVDIDPYRIAESLEKGKNDNYQSFAYRAEDGALPSKLSKFGFFDEVWALYSVPHYLRSEKDIATLFLNIDALLAPGGVARIFPLTLNVDDLFYLIKEKGGDAGLSLSKTRINTVIDSIYHLNTIGYLIEIKEGTLLMTKPKVL